VWKELLRIRYGSTTSYSEVARRISRPRAARAIGQACSSNPIAIVIPCHRVVGANGDATGYSAGAQKKLRLIEFENGSPFQRSSPRLNPNVA
jgi:methylated-DNA-[protein]-cysteine S-methyltransferase